MSIFTCLTVNPSPLTSSFAEAINLAPFPLALGEPAEWFPLALLGEERVPLEPWTDMPVPLPTVFPLPLLWIGTETLDPLELGELLVELEAAELLEYGDIMITIDGRVCCQRFFFNESTSM